MIAANPAAPACAGRAGMAPHNIVDVQTVNGDVFYWADVPITAPAVLTANGNTANATYLPWLTSAGPLKINRSRETNMWSFGVQNLSGDTLSSDMSKILRRTTLEGALCVYRIWAGAGEFAWREFHSTLTVIDIDPGSSVELSARSIFDSSRRSSMIVTLCETCQLRWGGLRCGVTIVPAGTTVQIDPVPMAHTASTPAHSAAAALAPNFLPVGGPGDPGDPGGGTGGGGDGGGGGTGSPGNPGDPTGGNATVTSTTECLYSYSTCQAPERILVVMNHYEKNFGETQATMSGTPRNLQRQY